MTPQGPTDSAWFAEIQGGAGCEIRLLNRHFIVYADLRGFGRFRQTGNDTIYSGITDTNGNQTLLLGNQSGILGRFGTAVFF
jgi:hypothetical protein